MNQKLNLELLVFKINQQFMAIETRYIREIIENKKSYLVPVECEHIKKIILHRDQAIAILNPQFYFQIQSEKDDYCIILDEYIALPADEIGGIFKSNQFKKVEKDNLQFIETTFSINDSPIFLINYNELIENEGKVTLFSI